MTEWHSQCDPGDGPPSPAPVRCPEAPGACPGPKATRSLPHFPPILPPCGTGGAGGVPRRRRTPRRGPRPGKPGLRGEGGFGCGGTEYRSVRIATDLNGRPACPASGGSSWSNVPSGERAAAGGSEGPSPASPAALPASPSRAGSHPKPRAPQNGGGTPRPRRNAERGRGPHPHGEITTLPRHPHPIADGNAADGQGAANKAGKDVSLPEP